MGPEGKQTVGREGAAAPRTGGLRQARESVESGGRVSGQAQLLLSLQRSAGNRAVSGVSQRLREGSELRAQPTMLIQRTIDQDARRWAMDWLATWTRSFPKAVKRLQLPKLYAICTGVMGVEQPLPGAAAITPVARAQYTTALAAGLVQMGEKSAGELSARLADGKQPGLDELMQRLDGAIPDTIPAMKVATPQTVAAHQALRLDDPFMKLTSGGAQFTFGRDMAEHMLRRHHPLYLSGAPLQVQSFFDETTSIPQIKAIIEGTVNASKDKIAEWRKFRRTKGTNLAGEAAKNLNLRPSWDGRYWELTLTLDSDNPTESRGKVAHFTPTL
jgi:hypothetical protein